MIECATMKRSPLFLRRASFALVSFLSAAEFFISLLPTRRPLPSLRSLFSLRGGRFSWCFLEAWTSFPSKGQPWLLEEKEVGRPNFFICSKSSSSTARSEIQTLCSSFVSSWQGLNFSFLPLIASDPPRSSLQLVHTSGPVAPPPRLLRCRAKQMLPLPLRGKSLHISQRRWNPSKKTKAAAVRDARARRRGAIAPGGGQVRHSGGSREPFARF